MPVKKKKKSKNTLKNMRDGDTSTLGNIKKFFSRSVFFRPRLYTEFRKVLLHLNKHKRSKRYILLIELKKKPHSLKEWGFQFIF